jgi:hypothetical protein
MIRSVRLMASRCSSPLSAPGVLGKSQDFSVAQYDLQTRRFRTLPGSEGMLGPRWSPDGRWFPM